MNTLLAVFALLCAVGSVFCGPTERRDPPGPISPVGLRDPVRLWPLRSCLPQHGNWHYDILPRDKWPVSRCLTTFYFGCKVWRPSWSSCKGYCLSSQNITTRIPPRYDNDCKCCKSYRYQLVRPYPYCWVVRTNSPRPSVRFEVVPQYIENYRYAVVGSCGCQQCGGIQLRPDVRPGPPGPDGPDIPLPAPLPETPEEIDEDQVTGRPAPPEPEEEVDLEEAFREMGAPQDGELGELGERGRA